jgi:hypothetical protein
MYSIYQVNHVATNTRVQLIHITDKIIKVRILDQTSHQAVLIPRIRFKFRLKYGQSYSMMRCQFPLRLAYAFTYNKAQGQTLHKILLDCRKPPFEHGHLYVAMFMAVIPNIVYPTIISHSLN